MCFSWIIFTLGHSFRAVLKFKADFVIQKCSLGTCRVVCVSNKLLRNSQQRRTRLNIICWSQLCCTIFIHAPVWKCLREKGLTCYPLPISSGERRPPLVVWWTLDDDEMSPTLGSNEGLELSIVNIIIIKSHDNHMTITAYITNSIDTQFSIL